jgi:Zn finger protein HypA/HybF involved in hydrogenase expression
VLSAILAPFPLAMKVMNVIFHGTLKLGATLKNAQISHSASCTICFDGEQEPRLHADCVWVPTCRGLSRRLKEFCLLEIPKSFKERQRQ